MGGMECSRKFNVANREVFLSNFPSHSFGLHNLTNRSGIVISLPLLRFLDDHHQRQRFVGYNLDRLFV